MLVFRSFHDIDFPRAAWVTVGTFDGFHLGHGILLERLKTLAERDGAASVLITFDPHPQNVIGARVARIDLLTPPAEKLRILESFGLDAVVVLPFTGALSRLSPGAFLDELRRPFRVRGMISGTTHSFGSGRSGSAALIEAEARRHGFAVHVEPPVIVEGETVSSTAIRGMLAGGDAGKAARFLGRFYGVSGTVVRGKGLGASLGFPTANLLPEDPDKLVPKDGIYAARVADGSWTGAGTVHVGPCPTVGQEHRSIEVHVHEFSGNMLGRFIRIDFVERLRSVLKFESTAALQRQMVQDIEQTRQWLLKTT